MSSSNESAPRPRRWLKLVALQLAVLVLGLLAVEFGTRACLWMQGDPYDSAQTRREAIALLDVNRQFVPRSRNEGETDKAVIENTPDQPRLLHPYLGWEMLYGNAQINDDYQWSRTVRKPGDVQILIVGGSVAAGFCLEEMGGKRLRELLLADPRFAGRELRTMDYGRGGFKQPQQINFVVYLLALGFEPDAVVNIDGFNEVALGNENHATNSHPSFPSASHWSHLVIWGTSDRSAIDKVAEIRKTQRTLEEWGVFLLAWRLDQSCVLGKLALHRMYRLRRVNVNQFSAYAEYLASRRNGSAMRGPTLEGDGQTAAEASVQCWKESSRALSDICRARGILYLHVLQPTLHDAGSKPLTEKEIANGTASESWMRGARRGYPLLRKEGEDLRRLGVDFIDASMLFANRTDDLYFDSCHFVRAGHELLAEKIAAELLARWPEKHAESGTLPGGK